MKENLAVDAMRTGWLVLTAMMLISRVVFQAQGPASMREFLDTWKRSRTKRRWGAACLAYAGLLALATATVLGELSTMDLVLTGALLAVLLADGLVNVLPAGFETFKDRLQAAWVARFGASGRGGDEHLFGAVNLLLALAAGGVAAVVVAYEPIDFWIPAVALAVAVALTALLIAAARGERRAG